MRPITETWKISPYTDSEDNHVDSAGNHAIAPCELAPGDVIYTTSIESTTDVRTRTSVQVGANKHLENELLMYMDHSYDPSTRFEINGDTLSVIAIKHLFAGDALTFDYNTTESTMSCPFFDNESKRWVSGYNALTEAEKLATKHVLDHVGLAKDDLGIRAKPFVKGQYPEQSSRQALRGARRAQGGPGIELVGSSYQVRGV